MFELYASYKLFFINVFFTKLSMSLKHWASHSIHNAALEWLVKCSLSVIEIKIYKQIKQAKKLWSSTNSCSLVYPELVCVNGCRTPENSLPFMHSSQPADLVSCTEHPTPIQPQVSALNKRCSTQRRSECLHPDLVRICSSPYLLFSPPARGRLQALETQGRSSAHNSLDSNSQFQLGYTRNPPSLLHSPEGTIAQLTAEVSNWRNSLMSGEKDHGAGSVALMSKMPTPMERIYPCGTEQECDMGVNNIPTLLEVWGCHTQPSPPQQTLTEVQIQPASELTEL